MPLAPKHPQRPLLWSPVVRAIQETLAGEDKVYVVGGAVRDAYLHRALHDIDLATPEDGRPLARRISNRFDGAYYPLDAERGVGRALIAWEGAQLTVDVAQFRGPDLLSDLQHRDFTVNAMAVCLAGDLQAVIDPLGGLTDLDAKRLRQCSPDSISSDPVRALRAVRSSISFGLLITPDTRQALKACARQLTETSPERIRDEFFQILGGKHPASALDTLYRLGLLEQIIPEVVAMQNVAQAPPHQFDVWRHTLNTIKHLDTLLKIITDQRDDNLTANAHSGMIVFVLSALLEHLRTHIAHLWSNNRSHRSLMVLSALLHDAGKPVTRSVEGEGRVRFLKHERTGKTLTQQRAHALHLSKDEIVRLTTIVRHHMRPHWLGDGPTLTSRAIYRFWRDTGPAGVDICLLAMADYLGTYEYTLDPQAWIAYLDTLRTLLEHYFLRHDTAVAPPPLITGRHLLEHFDLEPGPQIGELLEQVREAQVEGEVSTREEALTWVQRLINNHS